MMQADRARWTHTKASSRRARQIVGRVSWPEHCVQVRQTTKQVVVQRFGLTTERKATRFVATKPSRMQMQAGTTAACGSADGSGIPARMCFTPTDKRVSFSHAWVMSPSGPSGTRRRKSSSKLGGQFGCISIKDCRM